MWTDPSLTSEPSTGEGNYGAKIEATDFLFNRIHLQAGKYQTGNFDELRIGTTFSDVAMVPEPSTSIMLLTLAAVALLRYIRRRRV